MLGWNLGLGLYVRQAFCYWVTAQVIFHLFSDSIFHANKDVVVCVYFVLASNSLFSSLCLLWDRIAGMHHHARLPFFFFKLKGLKVQQEMCCFSGEAAASTSTQRGLIDPNPRMLWCHHSPSDAHPLSSTHNAVQCLVLYGHVYTQGDFWVLNNWIWQRFSLKERLWIMGSKTDFLLSLFPESPSCEWSQPRHRR